MEGHPLRFALPHQQGIVTNVLEECNATFFRVRHCSSTAWPWSWRDYALPKYWQLNSSQHNETSQKTWIFEGCTVCILLLLETQMGVFPFLLVPSAQVFSCPMIFDTPSHHRLLSLTLCMRNSVYIFTSAFSTSFYMRTEYWVCTIGNFPSHSLAYQLVSTQLLH